MKDTLLLAEDSADDAYFFRRTLKSAGVMNPLKVVHDGAEAIAYLGGEGAYADRKKFPIPSALFLDLHMPRVDGFQVLQWINTQPGLNGLLIVVLTRFNESRLLQNAYNFGADTFLFKPFTRVDLEGLIQNFHDYFSVTKNGESKLRGAKK